MLLTPYTDAFPMLEMKLLQVLTVASNVLVVSTFAKIGPAMVGQVMVLEASVPVCEIVLVLTVSEEGTASVITKSKAESKCPFHAVMLCCEPLAYIPV